MDCSSSVEITGLDFNRDGLGIICGIIKLLGSLMCGAVEEEFDSGMCAELGD